MVTKITPTSIIGAVTKWNSYSDHRNIFDGYADKECVIAYYDNSLMQIVLFKGVQKKKYFFYVSYEDLPVFSNNKTKLKVSSVEQQSDCLRLIDRAGIVVNKKLYDDYKQHLMLEKL